MTQKEELVVLLRTVADNQGATQTQNALRNVSQDTEKANTNLRRTGQVAQESGEGTKALTEQMLRFSGALAGVDIGLSLFTTAGETIRETIRGAIEAQGENERVTRATAAAYGASAEQFQRFAASLSQQTGFTSQSILEAALSARTLSTNYGLSIDQTQKLIAVSADLARVRGIGVAESFERIQSAIRGEAEASEFLGLTLNATFLQQNAANGAYRQSFTTLTDSQRAQVVYNEVLRQTAAFQGLAADSAGGLDGAMTRAATAGNKLQVSLGKLIEPQVVTTLQAQAQAANDLELAIEAVAKARERGGVGGALVGAAEFLPQLLPGADIVRGIGQTIRDLAQPQREAIENAREQSIQTRQLLNDQADIQSQLQSTNRHAQRFTQLLSDAQRNAKALNFELDSVNKTISQLGELQQGVGQNSPLQPQLAAATDLQQIDKQIASAKQAQQFLAEQRKTLQATASGNLPNQFGGPPGVLDQATKDAQRRLEILDQILPAEQAVIEAQQQQRDLQLAGTQIQAQEAALTLTILPQRQKIADIERQINDLGSSRVSLLQQQTVLLAQQRALQPQNALDDTQAQIQRDQLLLKVRGVDPETRRQARQQIRDLTRNVLPQQELNAFDANRQVSLSERDQRSTQIQIQLQQNALQQAKQVIQDAIQPTEDAIREAQNQGQQIQFLGQIAQALIAAKQQAIQVIIQGSVEVTTVGADAQSTIPAAVGQKVATDIVSQMREGLGQMQLPPAVQSSGVRRAA